MKEIIIGINEADKRLDSFLKSYLPNASGGFIFKMLRKRNITLNDKKASGTEKLKPGDSIKIFFADETLEKFHGVSNNTHKDDPSYKALETLGELDIIYEQYVYVAIFVAKIGRCYGTVSYGFYKFICKCFAGDIHDS